MILNAFRGFCMALADSVPGVSGGTIAFLMGFYDLFINSLNDLMGKDNKKRKKAILFIIQLGIGWVIGMALAVSVLASVFENGIYKVSSLFIGFIVLAIPVMIYEEIESIKGKYINLIWAAVGIAVVVCIAMLGSTGDTDVSHMSAGLAAYTFFAGMCAISAMVLPGISGSTILLTFGLYVPVVTSVKDVLHLKLSSLPICVVLALGAVAGIFVSLRLIKKALEKFRSQTIYCVLGMMIGSLYAIVKGPTTLKHPKPAMTWSKFSIVFFIIGAAIVFTMQAAKIYFEKKKKNVE